MYINKTERRESLQRLRKAARKLGIECLDTEWRGMNARYRLRCACGHEYTRTPDTILKQGRSCPECRNRACLARLHTVAEQHGGRCLEARHLGSMTPHRFACAKGHKWKATGATILQDKWCLKCARAQTGVGNRLSDGLDRLRKLARAKGGECLSLVYDIGTTRYHMRCAEGHEWWTVGATIFRGAWCGKCHTNSRLDTLENMQAIAAARGGSCLSTAYKKTKMTWLCHHGHSWSAIPAAIKKGHWCPTCAHMRKITNPKTRLKYLNKG